MTHYFTRKNAGQWPTVFYALPRGTTEGGKFRPVQFLGIFPEGLTFRVQRFDSGKVRPVIVRRYAP